MRGEGQQVQVINRVPCPADLRTFSILFVMMVVDLDLGFLLLNFCARNKVDRRQRVAHSNARESRVAIDSYEEMSEIRLSSPFVEQNFISCCVFFPYSIFLAFVEPFRGAVRQDVTLTTRRLHPLNTVAIFGVCGVCVCVRRTDDDGEVW